MKKLIILLTAAIMAMGMAIPTSADMIFANPADVLEPYYVNFARYGFTGYYNDYCFNSNNCYYEHGGFAIEDEVGYWIEEEDGVYYMVSKRIEGEDMTDFWANEGWKKAPLADALAAAGRYEYTLKDMATLQKYLTAYDTEISFHKNRFLDYNMDRELTSVDLSLIKYELLH
jgi:hypothetical protein